MPAIEEPAVEACECCPDPAIGYFPTPFGRAWRCGYHGQIDAPTNIPFHHTNNEARFA